MRPGHTNDLKHSSRRYHTARNLIDAIKLERGCTDCGYNTHPAALEFDHRDPQHKRFTISGNESRRWTDILTEIAKCDVVCANCHRIRTAHSRAAGTIRKRNSPTTPQDPPQGQAPSSPSSQQQQQQSLGY
jgi:hypothetical protein